VSDISAAPADLSAVLARIAAIQSTMGSPPASSGDFSSLLGVGSDSSTSASDASGTAATVTDMLAGPAATGASPTGSQVVADAEQYLGVPYQWGGTTTAGFDCSGLVQHVYADLGVSLPRTSEEQALVGQSVPSLADAQPGDLLFFPGSDGTASAPGHVGIYIGNGQMIDAPHTGTDVQVDSVASFGTPVAIRRIVGSDGTGAMSAMSVGTSTGRPAGLDLGSYAQDFVSAGAAYGVPAPLLASVARTESSLDPNAVSSAGAQGLMQLMPQTAAGLGVDPYDPGQAIAGAAQILAGNYQRFGSWPLAVAAYNAGSGAVAQYGGVPPYPETQAYVSKVLAGAGMAS
jgi:cell wall-associated NlpC family hydrolase